MGKRKETTELFEYGRQHEDGLGESVTDGGEAYDKSMGKRSNMIATADEAGDDEKRESCGQPEGRSLWWVYGYIDADADAGAEEGLGEW